MPLLQSLGLAPAKNAIRKLFRRSPADNGLKDQGPSSSLSLPGADDGTDNPARDSSPPLASHTNTDIEASKHTHNPEATTPHRGLDVMPMPAADQFSSQVDKENRPPQGHAVEDLIAPVKKLSIDTQDVSAVAADQQVEEEIIEDPAVLAERAHHLRFIEEALNMVRKTEFSPSTVKLRSGWQANVFGRLGLHCERMRLLLDASLFTTVPSLPKE